MSAATTQLVIIDRDGVINERVSGGVTTPEQLVLLPGSLEAIARLNHAGIRIAVAVRHPENASKDLAIESLNRTHARLQQVLARRGGHLDGLFISNPDESVSRNVHSRELLEDIATRFATSLEQTAVISCDLDLVRSAHDCKATAVLVPTETTGLLAEPNLKTAANLMAAANYIVRS